MTVDDGGGPAFPEINQVLPRGYWGGGTDPIGSVASRLPPQRPTSAKHELNEMVVWTLAPASSALFALSPPKAESPRLSLAKPRTTILPLLKQDSDCIFVCLYRGIHRPFFHTAARPESRPGADVRRRPLGSTTYTPPSPHTGIKLGPMTADGRDGDPIPSSWKTMGERRTQS